MEIGIPETNGTLRLWVQGEEGCQPHTSLWVEFDLHVFDVEYKGKSLAVLPIPSLS